MEMNPLNEAVAKVSVSQNRRSALRQMTSEQLLGLGMNQVVYLNVDAAVEEAIEQGLSFVAVH